MNAHADRDHSTWSASATSRLTRCPGSLALGLYLPDNETMHAARGTAAHQIAEKCLKTGHDAELYVGTIEHTKKFKIEIDEEIANSAQTYIDYVRDQSEGEDRWIEQKFSLSSLNPPFDAGGTADAVIYDAANQHLQVIDLKHGMGVVDVTANKQLRTYALGALLAFPHLKVQTVQPTIVQPRALSKAGPIRSETITTGELIEWTMELMADMATAKQALDEYEATGSNSVKIDDWADRWLQSGECHFCKAAGICPKQRKEGLKVVERFFEPGTDEIRNMPLDSDPVAIARDLDQIPLLEEWIKARRAAAHRLAEAGTTIPGWQLVEKHGNRRWIDPEAVKTSLTEWGFADKMFEEPKLKSPAQMEKSLGKEKVILADLVERPVTGTNLVSEERTSRPPAQTLTDKFFEPTKEN